MLQHTIRAVVRSGEESGYVAECVEIPVVTQGATLDEAIRNLKEAVELALEGEDLAVLGLIDEPTLTYAATAAPGRSPGSRSAAD